MKLSPIDVQQHQFKLAFRGFEPREVQSFLDFVAEQLADLLHENNELRAQLHQVHGDLQEHRERETSLKEAMLTAQRAIDEIREQSQKEAQLVVADAELRAEKALQNAHHRVSKILEEVADLKRQRTRFLEELRGLLSTHTKLLELHAQEGPEQELGEVTVLSRVRAPAPPVAEELLVTKKR